MFTAGELICDTLTVSCSECGLQVELKVSHIPFVKKEPHNAKNESEELEFAVHFDVDVYGLFHSSRPIGPKCCL